MLFRSLKTFPYLCHRFGMIPLHISSVANIEKMGIYSKELFFVKHLDWRDEDEYRVLVISEEEQIRVKITCNDDCFIKGLIMGTKFPYKAELIYRLRKTGLMNFVCLYNSTAKYDGVSVAHWTENEMNLF